ncbi:MAG: hypothetical protein ACSHYB_04970 [Roseibacillus sp.]
MKFLSLLAGCSLLGLSSCALSSDKVEEEDTDGPSIPPPTGLQASNTSESTQEQLPELPSSSEQSSKPTEKVSVKEIDGFVYEDVLNTLPSQRDLATPPTSLVPSSLKDEESQTTDDDTKPLVINP